MFNVGPFELLVLVAVALIVFGPDKLPQLAKDAGRMLRTLRDLAQGARTQLSEELGPTFGEFDFAKLNPKTALRDALLGDDGDFSALNPREAIARAMRGEDDPAPMGAAQAHEPVYETEAALPVETPPSLVKHTPVLREGEPAPFDPDAT